MSTRRSPSEARSLGHPLLDRYLTFVDARPGTTCRRHLLGPPCLLRRSRKRTNRGHHQRRAGLHRVPAPPRGREKVVRLADGEAGLTASTIKRRLSSVSGFYTYLVMTGALGANPVPKGIATRRRRRRRAALVPLLRTPRRLPKILEPEEVIALFKALRHYRDRAMVEAMVLGGLRRCEVLGLRFADLRPGEHRVFIADGKGGHQRFASVSARFFRSVARYMEAERPAEAKTERLFVVLKGPRRGEPLSDDGLEEIVRAAKARAGLLHATCHELRHTCLTRLREAGMALEASRSKPGTALSRQLACTCTSLMNGSRASTRAAALIDAQMLQAVAQ